MALSRYVLGALGVWCLVFSCAAKPKPAGSIQLPAKHGGTPSQESRMKKKAELIEKSLLQQCLAGGGSVALGRVARLEPIYPDTRGAKVIIHLEIEQQLYGKLPREVNYWVYGGLDQVKLPPRLMVAVYPPYEGTEEVELIASVGVPEGLEAESVQAHQQELAKLGTSPAPSGR